MVEKIWGVTYLVNCSQAVTRCFGFSVNSPKSQSGATSFYRRRLCGDVKTEYVATAKGRDAAVRPATHDRLLARQCRRRRTTGLTTSSGDRRDATWANSSPRVLVPIRRCRTRAPRVKKEQIYRKKINDTSTLFGRVLDD